MDRVSILRIASERKYSSAEAPKSCKEASFISPKGIGLPTWVIEPARTRHDFGFDQRGFRYCGRGCGKRVISCPLQAYPDLEVGTYLAHLLCLRDGDTTHRPGPRFRPANHPSNPHSRSSPHGSGGWMWTAIRRRFCTLWGKPGAVGNRHHQRPGFRDSGFPGKPLAYYGRRGTNGPEAFAVADL